MSFLILAYPKLKPAHFEWIQRHRSLYDPYLFQIVDPHFTIVFPVTDKTESEFLKAVENCSKELKRIEFEINNALVHLDLLSGNYLQFLIPGKGYNEIAHLHDQLYAGELKNNLRKDLPFVPHITIGRFNNHDDCEWSVAEFNALNVSMAGTIDSITVVSFEDNIISAIKTIQLIKQ